MDAEIQVLLDVSHSCCIASSVARQSLQNVKRCQKYKLPALEQSSFIEMALWFYETNATGEGSWSGPMFCS